MAKNRIMLFFNRGPECDKIEQAFPKQDFDLRCGERPVEIREIWERFEPEVVIVRDVFKKLLEQMKIVDEKTILLVVFDRQPLEIVQIYETADDYYLLNNQMAELVAKTKVLLRRSGQLKDEIPRFITLEDKGLVIHLDSMTVQKDGKPLDLTYLELKLLCLLISKRRQVFTRREIIDKICNGNLFMREDAVDIHIKRLREKLGDNIKSQKYIQTIYGLGYRFI